MNEIKPIANSSMTAKASLFLIVYILYFSFGIFHLTKFSTTDESVWWLYKRIPVYWRAVFSGDAEKTNINDKPGISVALISGIGYNLAKDDFEESFKRFRGKNYNYKKIEAPYLNIEKNLFTLRLPLLIFNGFFSLLLFWLIKKITGNYWVAFWSFIFILLSPILLGISQIINPDTLLWSFSAGTLLAFLAYLQSEKKSFALISSLSLGMALLSKYTATIFYPFFIVASFIFFACKIKNWQEANENVSEKIRKITLAIFGIITGSIFLYAIFMPAVFKDPKLLYVGTIGFTGMPQFLWPLFGIQLLLIFDSVFFKNKFAILFLNYASIFIKKYSHFLYLFLAAAFLLTLLSWIENMHLVDFEKIRFDLGKSKKFLGLPLLDKTIFEIRPLVFSLTPVVLISLIYFWIKSFLKKKFDFFTFILSLFFVIFYAAVIFQGLLVTIRYSIVLYSLAAILAAIGLNKLFSAEKLKKIDRILISTIIIMISAGSLWLVKPFYFNYTNIFLPKSHLITGAWGYGGYEAAEYLNALPNAENLVIWSDYSGVCEFTKSKCYLINGTSYKDIDYFVLTRRGRINFSSRGDKTGARDYYPRDDYVWRLDINDRPGNYIKVFKNDKK